MFWNKKKPKSKPQIKTTVPKTFKAKEPPPKWQPTFGETKKEVVTVSPSFEMYGVNCNILGLKHVPVSYEKDLTINIENLFRNLHTDIEHGMCGEIIFYFMHVQSRMFWIRKTTAKERSGI